MEILFSLIIWVLCGFGCYKLAETQGRNAVVGAILGVLFGLLAVLGYLIIGKKKETN